MKAPRLFEWLLERTLPKGPEGDSIRGDLLEELMESSGPPGRWRYRRHALSLAARYAFRRGPRSELTRQRSHVMDALFQTVKFAVRSLITRPAFALLVVVTLALGIGANTAIFSILHALVLRSLPVTDPARLVVVSRNQFSLPYPLFRWFQDRSTTLDGLARVPDRAIALHVRRDDRTGHRRPGVRQLLRSARRQGEPRNHAHDERRRHAGRGWREGSGGGARVRLLALEVRRPRRA